MVNLYSDLLTVNYDKDKKTWFFYSGDQLIAESDSIESLGKDIGDYYAQLTQYFTEELL